MIDLEYTTIFVATKTFIGIRYVITSNVINYDYNKRRPREYFQVTNYKNLRITERHAIDEFTFLRSQID